MFVVQGVSPEIVNSQILFVLLRVPPPLAAERGGGHAGGRLLPPGLTPWAPHIPPHWG
jgi:hypothetical protein